MTLLDVFASRGKAEIIQLFFGIKPREIYLRQTARECHLALATVNRELTRLVKVGLLLTHKARNRRYFRANQASPAYEPIRTLVIEISGMTEKCPRGNPLPPARKKLRFFSLGPR